MSGLRYAFSSDNSSRIGIILAFVVLFLLFVYPNPAGLIFGLLRMAFLGLAVFLFIQFYQQEQKRGFPASGRGDTLTMLKNQPTSLEEEVKGLAVEGRFIIDLLADAMPGFGIAYYSYNDSSPSLSLSQTAGEEVEFASTISAESGKIEDFVKTVAVRFFTPGADEDAVTQFFITDATIEDGTTLLAVPVSESDEMTGAFIICAHQFGNFQDYHRPLVESFANVLAEVIGDEKSGDRSEEHLSFFKRLEIFQHDLDISRSREQLVNAIADFCKENFTFDKFTLVFLDPKKKDEAVAEEVIGYKDDFEAETHFHREKSLLWKVLDGEDFLSTDLTDESLLGGGRFSKGDTQNHHFFSFIGVPIQTDSQTMGCLVLESFSSGLYRKKEGRNLHIFSTRLGVLLDWWQKYDVIRETAMRDGLTGLLNHRSFVERFQQELQRAGRYNEKLVLMMLDLDKFKRINDNHGHLYGDYVLRGTSAVLKTAVRNIDIVARYGGEEFAIVLVKTTKVKTFNSAKRIVQSLADHPFEKEGKMVRMTISAGMAEYPTDGENMRELIAIADRAMYEVKGRGGNNVEVAGEITK